MNYFVKNCIAVVLVLFILSCGTEYKKPEEAQRQRPISNSKLKQFVNCNGSSIVARHDRGLELKFSFTIDSGYHIQPDNVADENFIKTNFKLKSSPEFTVISYVYKYEPKPWHLDHYGEFMVISNDFSIQLNIAFTKANRFDIAPFLEGELVYQACDATKCFFPRTLAVRWDTKMN
ncbi:hypothetical protein [Aestuariivivens sediminicola]|uniref:hypothetical protein n=1 Tax=Aestuariivivens sediminicola TaxID=2913560 RepID=UPI001F569785|nr:hypothetical protein [Aestuariivivens sediminicola]